MRRGALGCARARRETDRTQNRKGDTLTTKRTDHAIAATQIRTLEQTRAQALVAGDVSTLRTLFDEDVTITHSNGTRDAGEEFLDRLGAGRLRYADFDIDITTLTVRADHAVAIGTLSATVILPDGATHPIQALSTTVWSRAEDHWRVLAAHTTTAATG